MTGDSRVPMSHVYAHNLTAQARALRKRADDAAWDFDFDVEAELIEKARHLEHEAEELISRPSVPYPLF